MMDRPKYLAVDFDDTLFIRNSWRDFEGHANEKLVELVKVLQNRNWKIILWTSRNGSALNEAVEWCKAQGIRLDFVNENPEAIQWFKDVLGFVNSAWSNKVFADVYIDDSAFNSDIIEGCYLKGTVTFLEEFCENRHRKKVLGQ